MNRLKDGAFQMRYIGRPSAVGVSMSPCHEKAFGACLAQRATGNLPGMGIKDWVSHLHECVCMW